jgi:hypothetical protein
MEMLRSLSSSRRGAQITYSVKSIPDGKRFFQASKRQVPPFSVNSHPSMQNRSTFQLIYHLRGRIWDMTTIREILGHLLCYTSFYILNVKYLFFTLALFLLLDIREKSVFRRMKEEKGQAQPQLYGATYLLVSFTLTGLLHATRSKPWRRLGNACAERAKSGQPRCFTCIWARHPGWRVRTPMSSSSKVGRWSCRV